MDHWHPVLLCKKLKRNPVSIKLNGKNIVLFRTGRGLIGALDDCCAHRRMRLSLGKVVDGRLQCKYHGWTFNRHGEGESPGTPKLHANTKCYYDTLEQHGVIWLKSENSSATFPKFEVSGYYHLCTLHHLVKAPLELILDNFTEIEHSATTHLLFGYELDRMSEVRVRFETTDSTVRTINIGPHKQISPILRLLLGVRKNALFNDDWTTHFSPVFTVIDHWWSYPGNSREGKVRFRFYVFFTPLNEQETALMTFAYAKSTYPGPYGGIRLFKPMLIWMANNEIRRDIQIVENLADKNSSIEGMTLSRFDRNLILNRERIDRIYRGGGDQVDKVANPPPQKI